MSNYFMTIVEVINYNKYVIFTCFYMRNYFMTTVEVINCKNISILHSSPTTNHDKKLNSERLQFKVIYYNST